MRYISEVTIRNFKAFDEKTFELGLKNYIFIGDNDSGKSTLLEALDIFFNNDKIDKKFARDDKKDVVIEVKVDNENSIEYFKKTFKKGATFKFDPDNSENLEKLNLNYILVSPLEYDVASIIKKFAVKRAVEKIGNDKINELNDLLSNSAHEVIESMDKNLITVNPEIVTLLKEVASIKIEKAFEISVESEGIQLDCRGLGYRRNVVLSLIAQSHYENTIIAIDEIENSFSLRNVSDILEKIHENFPQSLITTHSVSLLSFDSTHNIYPLCDGHVEAVAEMYRKMGKANETKKILLVEGITDCYWFRRALAILGFQGDYYVLPVNGKDNISKFLDYYQSIGEECVAITDGDDKKEYSLSKETIELYTPLDFINKEFGKRLTKLSDNKDDFFTNDLFGFEKKRVKKLIATKVNEFLKEDNPIIQEIKNILDNNK